MKHGVLALACLLVGACAWLPGDVDAFKRQHIEAFETLPLDVGFDIVEQVAKADRDSDGATISVCASRAYRVRAPEAFPPASDQQASWKPVAEIKVTLPDCASAAMRAYLERVRGEAGALVFFVATRAGGSTAADQFGQVRIERYMLLDSESDTLYTSFLMVDPTI